jgi:hypothetical protein
MPHSAELRLRAMRHGVESIFDVESNRIFHEILLFVIYHFAPNPPADKVLNDLFLTIS